MSRQPASAKRRSNADGSFAGAYVLGVPVNSLARQLERTGLPNDTEVSLLDTTGQVFASNHWAMLDEDVMKKIRAGDTSFFERKSVSGQDREIAVVPLAGNEFYALLSAPKPPPIALENVSAFGNFALPLLAWLLVTAWQVVTFVA